MNRRGFLFFLPSLLAIPVVAKFLPKSTPLAPINDALGSALNAGPIELVSNRDMRIPLVLKPGGYFGHYDPEGGSLGPGLSAHQYIKCIEVPKGY